MKFHHLSILTCMLSSGLWICANAETPQEKGLAIAKEADKREEGFQDTQATLTMELINKAGESSTRELRIKTLEVKNDGDKSLTIFDTPKDVQGTAFLTFSHKVGDDDQWLYLPKIKRVKRISSSNKSGPFMGSEFAYEDLSSQEVEKYTYQYLKDEACGDGFQCFVVERVPVYKKSGYKRQIIWLDKQEYRLIKSEFYDRKNELLKTLTAKGHKKYIEKYWRPAEMKMVNHQTGKKTILTWSNYSFKTGLNDKDFNKNSLKRAK